MPKIGHLSDSESGSGSDNETKSDSGHSGSDSDSGSSSAISSSGSSNEEQAQDIFIQSTPTVSLLSENKTRFFGTNSKNEHFWNDSEDIYNIRRSGRTRKEPERLKISQSKHSIQNQHSRKLPNQRDWQYNISSSESYDEQHESALASESDDVKRRGIQILAKTETKLKPKQNSCTSDDSSLDSDDEKRRLVSRRTLATISYKEASDEEKTDSEDLVEVEYLEAEVRSESEKSETIEKILGHRRGKKGITGNITTMYAIEENGDPNVDTNSKNMEKTEEQYLIKWKGWAHIHNTWESEQSLTGQKVKGMKKLENYVKKEYELAVWRKQATPEDIDYFECQLELQQELLKSYTSVERIIAKCDKSDGGGMDYYLKWESLPYSDATWEDSSLIVRKWPDKIVEFQEREESKRTPSRNSKVLKCRPKFQEVKTQPSYMGIERGLILRDYQMDGLNWLIHSWCKENSVILADEMGLGKTIQTICYLYYLFNTHLLFGPFLCVVPLSTMTSWRREFAQWAPELNLVTYIGDVNSRNIIRQCEWSYEGSKRLKFNAILTTYEIVLKDKAFLGSISWAILLVDEAHRLKNDDSLLYKALMEFDTNHRLLITGTPLQNSLKELWALLHFIMPNKFVEWEEFEKDHEDAAQKGYSKLHKQLEPFILRRVKKDVEKSLPAKVEQILRVEMTSIQKQYYKWILTKNYSALRKGVRGSTSTFLNIVIELKKCCNHALLTKPMEWEVQSRHEDAVQQLLRGSGKLVLLDKLLTRLRETGHRVLIFSQMVRMLDILGEYLQKRHFPFQRLDGSIKGELRRQALDHFNADGSVDFCFLLSTRAGGLGINLATADTVIIFDSDWNPQNDLQAQARAHRIGQKSQVNIYRLVTARSVEEEIVERAKKKMVLDHLVIQRMDTTGRTILDKKASSNNTPFNKEDLNAILKFGAEDLFKDEEEREEELTCDIDEILQRAETRDEGQNMVGDELLSAFKVATFSAFDEDKEQASVNQGLNDESKDWDDIIPENLRRRVEEEERSREIEDLYLPPRSRKTLQQINQSESDDDCKTKNKRKQTEESSTSGDEDSNEGGRPKKRGRPPLGNRERIKGFTDAEIRRFVKSYKKFPAPLKRLDAVACDAELQEKPLPELKKLGEMLRERCLTYMGEHFASKENNESNSQEDVNMSATRRRKRVRGPSFKLGGVSVNAKTMLACEKELEPLDEIISIHSQDRLNWVLEMRTKPAHFDVEWTCLEDSKLLLGIYQYGMGSWEAIKMDPSLAIGDKILFNEDKKPQAKHLQTRAEYLLKIIKKNLDIKKGVTKPKRQRKTKEAKPLTKEIIENDEISSMDDTINLNMPKRQSQKLHTHVRHLKIDEEVEESKEVVEIREKKKSRKSIKKKPEAGPMHFTANNEPRALEVLGDLDPSVFNECKEKMRPVKKALKALDNPDQSLSETEQVNHTRMCLLQIGEQINICLEEYIDPDKIKEWRSNLWYFVSKFTEFDAKKLYKLYKHASKKNEKESRKNEKELKNEKNLNSKHDCHQKDTAYSINTKEKDESNTHESRFEVNNKRRYDTDSERNPEKETKKIHSERSHDKKERGVEKDKVNKIYEENYAGDEEHEWNKSLNKGTRKLSKTLQSQCCGYKYESVDSKVTYSDAIGDRWIGQRNRFGNKDHKRERHDGYQRVALTVYHRDRESGHCVSDKRSTPSTCKEDRDRNRSYARNREQVTPVNPRRYNSHYRSLSQGFIPQTVFPENEMSGALIFSRDRYSPGEWHDREYRHDYDREYDRRHPDNS